MDINQPFVTQEQKFKYWEESKAEIQKLRAQLPVGMQHCTIVFKRCEHGHGTLTATNWVQHECETCLINSLRAKVASAEVLGKYANAYDGRDAMMWRKVSFAIEEAINNGNCPYLIQDAFEEALATYDKLSEVKHEST